MWRSLPYTQTGKTELKSTSLRTQLLRTILPGVLLPLGLAGLVSYGIISSKSQQQTAELLNNEALLASEVVNELVQESKKIPATIARNPLVINTARASATAAKTANLPNLPIAQVEQSFATTKVLQPDNGLNEYLKKTAEISEFAELFFTEKNGFNVAYSNPTSDFVQRDEKWWQNAKEDLNDQFIEPTFDRSSNTFGLELSQAIVDPNSGEFLGVVKGVLPAKSFGLVLNNIIEKLHIGESQKVQILSLNSDNTITVISSIGTDENNNNQNQELLGGKDVNEAVKSLLASTQSQNSGRSVNKLKIESITSKSGQELFRTKLESEGRTYLLTTVPKTNWVVAVSLEVRELKAPGKQAGLTLSLAFLILGGVIAGAILFLARRLATPLKELSNTAEQVINGNLNVQATPSGPTETQVLAQVFNNLVTGVKGLLHQQAVQTEQTELFAELAASRIRSETDLDELFQEAVQGALRTLNADRVVIYRFYSDWRGYIATEAVVSGWPRALGDKIEDPCIGQHLIDAYRKGRVVPTNNVYEAGFHPDHLKLMERLQIKANLVTPILKDEQLFGLLIAHHCHEPHSWQQSEVDFLRKLAIQLGLSLDRLNFVIQKDVETQRAQQLNEITSNIRESATKEDIYNAAITGVRKTLKTDRAIVYLFDENWKGSILAESVGKGWPEALGAKIADPCFADRYVDKYKLGRVKATNNIYDAGLTACHLNQLEPFKVKANLVAPILAYGNLHGLLVTHQCSSTRQWQEAEITFFKQIAIQLGLALDRLNYLSELDLARQKAEKLAEEQKEQKETIQMQLVNLLNDVEGVARGDLTVRADVTVGEIGTVADFFNSIVENLREIVTRVKEAVVQVNMAVGEDEEAISQLSEDAIKQAEETTQILNSVEQMSRSIEEVAENARQAAIIATTASNTAEQGQSAMDLTVENILGLRNTIGETAKKVKRLGESSQQIAKVVSIIEKIALQTNLLAINAGIEAARAGEEGQGFAVVAEEVGQLATKSTAATKEIEEIVDSIQRETAQVVEAMEQSTKQVVEGTHLVDKAKHSLREILEVSRQIDQLVAMISEATVSQTETSQSVSSLMYEIAMVSARTSDSSTKVSNSLQKTVEVARELQESVGTFKVD
ncbi:MAG TPA: chemotaxis protein CheD [Cyanobacteria bacterium UBA11149]|nr:chemotaxis protein CheD [Cyanobacteria bacterium UBA11367]HBE56110.1 chemotaxis protein CheD [Cyanobacteria bacterium UBA11366]HBK65845.1 chemotaxis protein CheD [Cyanobacteria bacterium UBA11166]HBR75145.1 chemotaxis protein CheD [Cyanobacteria bacterium UBA11159]HBS70100.1 chemotaxis protein CheD [Cyanobacteria bacterium UBA11153]HBW90728.1 chemotaxis protein CheD [Cyanobacteria bacterium UBA11149]HCA93449.1 chemotaxis protein CheD [Cyanobacteria bacterium UBA9226]